MTLMICFFFSSRRRHTRCSRDWSSDVCSSDLLSRLEDDEELAGETEEVVETEEEDLVMVGEEPEEEAPAPRPAPKPAAKKPAKKAAKRKATPKKKAKKSKPKKAAKKKAKKPARKKKRR